MRFRSEEGVRFINDAYSKFLKDEYPFYLEIPRYRMPVEELSALYTFFYLDEVMCPGTYRTPTDMDIRDAFRDMPPAYEYNGLCNTLVVAIKNRKHCDHFFMWLLEIPMSDIMSTRRTCMLC